MTKEKKKKTHVPLRLNLLFFAVFLLFSVLILRLGLVQIVYGDDYKREIERTEEVTVNNPVPRGKMYDRNLKVMVDNKPLDAITYTRSQRTTAKEMLETAEKLAKLIHKETNKITERDRKDFWILKHPDEAEAKITAADRKKVTEGELEEKDLYKLQIERITEKEINSFTDAELEVLAIYREFSSGYALTPQIVKNKDVTEEEFARVSENLDSLPGVNITTDWDRTYVFGNTLKSVLGKVSTSDEGLPSERLDYFLSRGYSRNDRVGKSYIELQYEDVLQGNKAKVKNITDKGGNVVESQVVSEGQRGKDLVLTIDMDLQQAIENEIEKQLLQAKKAGNTKFLDRAFVVLMDPKTGEILTMAGKQYVIDKETGKPTINDYALGNISSSYTVGSSVKGATILTGYQTGAIQPNKYFYDTTLNIKGTPKKASYTNMGNINDLTALKKSSNVYMFRTAIAIAGTEYVPGKGLNIGSSAFETMRNYYAQFGLGSRTGIDLPNEMVGYKGTDTLPGKLLDLAIGQYDTYTPMQLAQYVSTIANGGYRMEPHMVKEIHDPVDDNTELGAVVSEITPTVLNKLDMKDSWINRVQDGFKLVAMEQGGTAYKYFGHKSYTVAAKTGTAQAFYDGPNKDKYKDLQATMSLSMVGFAPAENPEVAFAVVVPWAYQGHSSNGLNGKLAEFALDTYFDLKKTRQQADETDETTENKVVTGKEIQQEQAE
ncbi:peptidoglycan D,D-transpeptidase FtsI family protein [Peribacillus loiseleuriae]|uniref:serine-type D-Ala-D-Ala carboxypeptidase n=1 Tax=Peribacillus loiseleuriae TaxID=1679170 RepID=A0A0K9GVY3_9BACI|nr:penicillin-binding protein 2 [Peribacillus loiseleuriae]KMY50805.1 penicillin-binding protein [Peribacillus loiseleuriae]